MRAMLPAFACCALAALSCAMPLVVAAAEATDRVAVLAQVGVEDDADEFGNLLLRGGALFDYQSHLQHWGLALQNAHYSQDGWSENVAGVIGLYRNQRADTLEGLRAEARHRVGRRSRTPGGRRHLEPSAA